MTEQELLDAGYKKHSRSNSWTRSADFLFQKAIWGDGVKQYFINIWQYVHTHLVLSSVHRQEPGYECEVQFGTYQGRVADVTLFSGEMDVASVEEFYERMFHAMGFKPYGEE